MGLFELAIGGWNYIFNVRRSSIQEIVNREHLQASDIEADEETASSNASSLIATSHRLEEFVSETTEREKHIRIREPAASWTDIYVLGVHR